MNDRIEDLLELAADDEGRPLPFTTAELTARGRAASRRRLGVTSLAAVGVAAAVVTAVSLTGLLTPGSADESAPSSPPSLIKDPTRDTTSMSDDGILNRCRSVAAQVRTAQNGKDQLRGDAGGAILTQGTTPDVSTWTLDARVTDVGGTTATLVAPDASAYLVCSLTAGTEAETQPDVRTRGVTALSGGISLKHDLLVRQLDTERTLEWNPICVKPGDEEPCPSRVVRGAFERYDGVRRIEVTTADGQPVKVTLGKNTWLVRHIQAWDTEGKTPAQLQSYPPLKVTYFGKGGQVLESRSIAATPGSACLGASC